MEKNECRCEERGFKRAFLYTWRRDAGEGFGKRVTRGEENASRVAATLLYFCFSRSQSHAWLLSYGTYFITIFFLTKKGEKRTEGENIRKYFQNLMNTGK